jgi:hypothetical protein
VGFGTQQKYRLAPNNVKKRRIVKEVIALVQNQNAPGLFLKRGPTDAGWWIEEVCDSKAMEKTRLALARGY